MVYSIFIDVKFDNDQKIYEVLSQLIKPEDCLQIDKKYKFKNVKSMADRLGINNDIVYTPKNYDATICFYSDSLEHEIVYEPNRI